MADLLTTLLNYGLPDDDALEMALAWPNANPDVFLTGLKQVANSLALGQKVGGSINEPPFDHFVTEINAASTVNNGFNQAMKAYDPTMQFHMLRAVTLTMQLEKQKAPKGKSVNQVQAARVTIQNKYLPTPDPAFRAQLEAALNDKRLPSLTVCRQAGESLLLEWLNQHGRFIKSNGRNYYFFDDAHRLYPLGSDNWRAWLHALTGLNPASKEWQFMDNAAISASNLSAKESPVIKLAYWDKDTQILRVSRFDGTVYVLDGQTIKVENNGDGPALFLDAPTWEAVEPEGDELADFVEPFRIPTWGSDGQADEALIKAEHERWTWAAQVWLLSMFFSELCPTRPIAVFLGEKGSGKSMALRLFLRLVFGRMGELSGVPEKPDDFQVAVSNNHILALDNFDGFNDWMRDKLASLATGIEDQTRTLYTNNEMTRITYRCWVAVTARTPDTLKRDDLADRLLILPLRRIPEGSRVREEAFLSKIISHRPKFWGGMLKMLNQVVAAFNEGGIPDIMSLRLADWEAFGQVASRATGKEYVWAEIVRQLKKSQGDFLAADVVVEAVTAWLSVKGNVGRPVKARELYAESQAALFSVSPPDKDWPRSLLSFSLRLKNVSEYLKNAYGLRTWQDRKNYTLYEFTRTP